MSSIRRFHAIHGSGFTVAVALLLGLIAIVFASMLGVSALLVFAPAASPLMTLISVGCGIFLLVGAVRLIV